MWSSSLVCHLKLNICCENMVKWWIFKWQLQCQQSKFFRVVVFNATFNNISIILRRSVSLVEEIGVPRENHGPVTNHWQTLSHNVVSSSQHNFFLLGLSLITQSYWSIQSLCSVCVNQAHTIWSWPLCHGPLTFNSNIHRCQPLRFFRNCYEFRAKIMVLRSTVYLLRISDYCRPGTVAHLNIIVII